MRRAKLRERQRDKAVLHRVRADLVDVACLIGINQGCGGAHSNRLAYGRERQLDRAPGRD